LLRFTARLSKKPAFVDYLLAAGLVVLSVIGRAAFDLITPGAGPFVLLFPALVIAGVFFGTAPAAVAAAAGGVASAVLVLGQPLLIWPPFNAAQLDLLLFVPACAIVLWATASLRRAAFHAAAAEARLREVFRQIPGAAAILEAPDGRLLLRSGQSDSVLGHPAGRVQQSGDLDTYGGIHDDGRPFAADDYPIVRALKTGEIVRGEKLLYRRADRLVDLEVHAGPVRDLNGNIVAAVGMAFDVSERLAAERQLQESEARQRAVAERLHAAVDAGSLGLWEVDLATQRVRLDATFAGMLGLPAESVEMARADLRRFVQPGDRARAAAVLDHAITEGGIYYDELHMRTEQGAERWFVTRGTVLADVQQVAGVVSDLTERRQREDALRAALEARDVLMHEADHRIKNSLQMVVSLLSLQRSRVADPDARQALGAAISRVEAIANAHLALQRSPDLRSIEIDRMLADLCDRVGSLNPAVALCCEARVELLIDADQAIPLGLLASEVLTNALRHAYPPGVAGVVTLTAGAAGGMLEMTIADAGAGMPAAPTRRGLGSTLIAALARQIGATVDTTSHPGAGTTVCVRLKLPAETGAPPGPVSDAVAAGPA
jgi:PAS domain S-box-containing protein